MTPQSGYVYVPFAPPSLPDRTWPSNTITRAPTFCAVDLRDGNQALENELTIEYKLTYFQMLVSLGFKEIEVGYPAANDREFAFVRLLIEGGYIPEDVRIQVLTAAVPWQLARTFAAIAGARRVTVHFYHATSQLHLNEVVRMTEDEVIDRVCATADEIVHYAHAHRDADVWIQFSPECFSDTSPEFARRICRAVYMVVLPTTCCPLILNCPATVEMATPNVYADQVELFVRGMADCPHTVISVHTHNDRGTGVAAAELALLAGATRVEGTLFDHLGERAGNCCLLTIAGNLFTQGIDPMIDLSDLPTVVATVESLTDTTVSARHPYAGSLVHVAFSGSHQHAIAQLLATGCQTSGMTPWRVPYMPVCPTDLGMPIERVIRINSQSGYGGVAHVLRQDHGITPPKAVLIELRDVVKQVAIEKHGEIDSDMLYQLFQRTLISEEPIRFVQDLTVHPATTESRRTIRAQILIHGNKHVVQGNGEGYLDAFVDGLRQHVTGTFDISDSHEHSQHAGADAPAVAYIALRVNGFVLWGVGIHASMPTAPVLAFVSALNRGIAQGLVSLNA
jgi:2-isopropylmalate synthase